MNQFVNFAFIDPSTREVVRCLYEHELILSSITDPSTGFCQSEDNWFITSFFWKAFYTLKFMFCYAASLRPRRSNRFDEGVKVGVIESEDRGYAWSVTYAIVGHGVFKGWWASHSTDGDCYL